MPTAYVRLLYGRARGYPLSRYFDEINDTAEFEHWYFAHHHKEIEFDSKHTLLYNNFVYLKNR